MVEFDLEVDTSGLNCPLPLLRLKKGLREIKRGGVIKIIATDPAAHLDIGVFVNQVGHKILESIKDNEKYIFYIKN